MYSSTTVEVYLKNPSGFEDSLNKLSNSNIDQYLSVEIENLKTPDHYIKKWNIFISNGKNKLLISFNFTKKMND